MNKLLFSVALFALISSALLAQKRVPPGGGGTTIVVSGMVSTAATVNFDSSIANGACDENTFAWSSAAAGDIVIPGWPSALPAGILPTMFVLSAGTIAVRLCNLSGGPVTVGSLIYKASKTTGAAVSTLTWAQLNTLTWAQLTTLTWGQL